MQANTFTEQQREDLLKKRGRLMETYNEEMDKGNFDAAEKYMSRVEQLDAQYFNRLPYLVMSVCPFDGKPLVRSFDPYGFDGLWWRGDATPQEPPACPHFSLLRGAVNYAGRRRLAGDFEVQPGPEVPYVIPRLLDLPEMIAVISEVRMKNGYIAYPIAYFAAHRPPPQELTADWARTLHLYRTQLGVAGWQAPNDPWDFDLLPWLRKGKIRWCPPGTDNTTLSTAPPDQCPYLNLPGVRQRVVVQADKSWTAGLPTGEPIEPIDA